MIEEIVFKTHTTPIGELNKRERQIFDAGYQSGLDDAHNSEASYYGGVLAAAFIILVLGTIIFCIAKWA